MGGAKKNNEDIALKENNGSVTTKHVQWVSMEAGHDISDSESMEDSSSSSDIVEDSSSSTSSSSPSYGPLYELSDLMAQLPIKRSLSKYYQGKSESFDTLASVKSLEELAKKGCCYKRRMKPFKSYGGGDLNGHNKYSPKATIIKKSSSSRGSFLSSLGKRGTLMGSCKPSIPLGKHF